MKPSRADPPRGLRVHTPARASSRQPEGTRGDLVSRFPLSQAQRPSPDLVPLPHEDAGRPCHGSRGGRGGWVPNTAKGPEVGAPGSPGRGPSPGAASARRSVSPSQARRHHLLRLLLAHPALATSAAAAAAASSPGALIPAPARHFRLCVLLRVRSREALPLAGPEPPLGGGAATSRARALCPGARWPRAAVVQR